MRFVEILVLFSILVMFSITSIKEFIVPRQPDVNRVRHIEDAAGDPLAVLDTVGLVERHGYPAEEHNITTEDGYNIVFFRIPGSPKSPPTIRKPIVFIQHGIFSSSDFFVLVGPKNDLVFVLADAGYDVWLGNVRGNTYARSHGNLTTDDKEFWNYSFHEMGTIDVSSMIDYALKHSGEEKLFYIGYSMGATICFVLLTEKPEYNEKMRLVVNLGPTAFWKYEPNLFYRFIFVNWKFCHILTDFLGIYDVHAQTKNNAKLFEILCGDSSLLRTLCPAILRLIAGEPAPGFDFRLLSFASLYTPAGGSTKTWYHFGQCYRTGVLQKYDNGEGENLRIYGTREPPAYDFSNMSAPIALFYGLTDSLSMPLNVVGLSKLIPNLVACEVVPSPVFNHYDFFWSPLAKDLLFPRIIELFSIHS